MLLSHVASVYKRRSAQESADKYNPLGANTRKPNVSGLHRGEFCLSGEINDRSFRGLLQDSLPVCFRELSSLS